MDDVFSSLRRIFGGKKAPEPAEPEAEAEAAAGEEEPTAAPETAAGAAAAEQASGAALPEDLATEAADAGHSPSQARSTGWTWTWSLWRLARCPTCPH